MAEYKNDKVINLFEKHSGSEGSAEKKFFKGFQYVKLKKDANGNYFKEEFLREYAVKCYYIVSVMKNGGIGVELFKYKVPYSSLLDFLNIFKNSELYGEIVDIEKYIPEDLA